MKFIKPSWMSVAAVGAALAPWQALAQTSPFTKGLQDVNTIKTGAGLANQSDDLPTIIGKVINVLLGFLGIIFLVLMIYAGFMWMTARGDEKKVETAVTMIRQAIIGLVVIISAFAISNFVLNSLVTVTST